MDDNGMTFSNNNNNAPPAAAAPAPVAPAAPAAPAALTLREIAMRTVDDIYNNINVKKLSFIIPKIDSISAEFINIEGNRNPPLVFLFDKIDVFTMANDEQAYIDRMTEKYRIVYEKLFEKGMKGDLRDDDETILFKAINKDGYSDFVEFLIKSGRVNIEATTSNGETPLHFACRVKRSYMPYDGDSDIVDDLIEAGANIEAITQEGKTPLHIACESGNLDIVKFLVEHGANSKAVTDDKTLPFQLIPAKYAELKAYMKPLYSPIDFVIKYPKIIILTGKKANTCIDHYKEDVPFGYDDDEGLQLKNKIDILTAYWKDISETVGCDIAFVLGHMGKIDEIVSNIVKQETDNRTIKREKPLLIFKVACMLENNMLELNIGRQLGATPIIRNNKGCVHFNIAIVGFYGLLQNQFLDLILCSKSKGSKLYYTDDAVKRYTKTDPARPLQYIADPTDKVVEPMLRCDPSVKECCEINKRLIRAHYRREFSERNCKLIDKGAIVKKLNNIVHILKNINVNIFKNGNEYVVSLKGMFNNSSNNSSNIYKDNGDGTYTIDPRIFNKNTFSFSYEDKGLEDIAVSEPYEIEFRNSRTERARYADDHPGGIDPAAIVAIADAEARAEERCIAAIERVTAIIVAVKEARRHLEIQEESTRNAAVKAGIAATSSLPSELSKKEQGRVAAAAASAVREKAEVEREPLLARVKDMIVELERAAIEAKESALDIISGNSKSAKIKADEAEVLLKTIRDAMREKERAAGAKRRTRRPRKQRRHTRRRS